MQEIRKAVNESLLEGANAVVSAGRPDGVYGQCVLAPVAGKPGGWPDQHKERCGSPVAAYEGWRPPPGTLRPSSGSATGESSRGEEGRVFFPTADPTRCLRHSATWRAVWLRKIYYYPCNPFGVGNRDPDPREQAPEIAKLLEEHAPKWAPPVIAIMGIAARHVHSPPVASQQ